MNYFIDDSLPNTDVSDVSKTSMTSMLASMFLHL